MLNIEKLSGQMINNTIKKIQWINKVGKQLDKKTTVMKQEQPQEMVQIQVRKIKTGMLQEKMNYMAFGYNAWQAYALG